MLDLCMKKETLTYKNYKWRNYMIFDMKKCLEAFSLALDLAEIDYLKIHSNHSRRVAYICMMIAGALNFNNEDKSDLFALSLLHDNGIVMSAMKHYGKLFEFLPDHCEEGEKNISKLPLYHKRENVILYHHENFNGTGLFKVKANEIPFFSQIIHLADSLDVKFNLQNLKITDRQVINNFVNYNSGILFNPDLITIFNKLSAKERFWADLNFYNIDDVLNRIVPEIKYNYEWTDVLKISQVFMDIIDCKSNFTNNHSRGLSEKISIMSEFYKFDKDKCTKLSIAANLHDIGKLFVPNEILEKPDKLDNDEFQIIKQHTYYTRLTLEKIPGFADIANWASNHHEKLNGNGYPESFKAEDLDFESRLMTVLDIYQALTEDRPYRKGLTHIETLNIMKKMATEGYIDSKILNDVDFVMNK